MSLALVLGSVFVALLTDFLKGNNEALRERNIELVVRQEERKHTAPRVAVPQPREAPARERAPRPAAEPQEWPDVAAARPVMAAEPDLAAASAASEAAPPSEEWATAEELEAVDAIAARIQESIDSRPEPEEAPAAAQAEREEEIFVPEPAAESTPEVEPVLTAEVPPGAETVDIPVDEPEPVLGTAKGEPPPETVAIEEESPVEVADDAEEHSDEESPEAAEEEVREREGWPRFAVHTKVTPIDVVAAERSVVAEALKLARELERVADLTPDDLAGMEAANPSDWEEEGVPAPADKATGVASKQAVSFSRDLFAKEDEVEESVADEAEDEAEAEDPELVHSAILTPVREAGKRETLPQVKVPTGFQEYSQLSEAMSSDALFRGTIVAIGVSESGRALNESILASVSEFVESLLTPADFGCQYSQDEFLVILPEELGSQAQRRLQYLSQRLWDFQIRTVGTQSIMFSWGAAEIKGEPLRDAIESAKDRMLQTRRTRERATSEIHHYRVRAAND